MSNFIMFIAWPIAVLSTLLLIGRLVGKLTYSDLQRHVDALKGIQRVYPVTWPFICSLVSWGWIICRPL